MGETAGSGGVGGGDEGDSAHDYDEDDSAYNYDEGEGEYEDPQVAQKKHEWSRAVAWVLIAAASVAFVATASVFLAGMKMYLSENSDGGSGFVARSVPSLYSSV